MLETGYPDFEAHQKIHTDLMIELNAMIANVVSQREFPEDLLYFLNQWLVNHIDKIDRYLSDYIKNSNMRPVAEQIYSDYL